MKCPKCKSEARSKSGFSRHGKQRYLCKSCGCNYTRSIAWEYSDKDKKEALRYHNEGIGFRRIERLLGMSHTSVINWVKKASEQIQEIIKERKTEEKVEVLELDEMCTILKKRKL